MAVSGVSATQAPLKTNTGGITSTPDGYSAALGTGLQRRRKLLRQSGSKLQAHHVVPALFARKPLGLLRVTVAHFAALFDEDLERHAALSHGRQERREVLLRAALPVTFRQHGPFAGRRHGVWSRERLEKTLNHMKSSMKVLFSPTSKALGTVSLASAASSRAAVTWHLRSAQLSACSASSKTSTAFSKALTRPSLRLSKLFSSFAIHVCTVVL